MVVTDEQAANPGGVSCQVTNTQGRGQALPVQQQLFTSVSPPRSVTRAYLSAVLGLAASTWQGSPLAAMMAEPSNF